MPEKGVSDITAILQFAGRFSIDLSVAETPIAASFFVT
jgi:hypothetical protein